MKKLAALLITILIAFAGHSQNDTTCIRNSDLIRKLQDLEQCKVDRAELQQKRQEVEALKNIVEFKGTMINDLTAKLKTEMLKSENDFLQMGNLEIQNSIQKKGIADLERALRNQKRKTFFTSLTGIIAIGGLTYLFIHH
jgi:hypothetical protein